MFRGWGVGGPMGALIIAHRMMRVAPCADGQRYALGRGGKG